MKFLCLQLRLPSGCIHIPFVCSYDYPLVALITGCAVVWSSSPTSFPHSPCPPDLFFERRHDFSSPGLNYVFTRVVSLLLVSTTYSLGLFPSSWSQLRIHSGCFLPPGLNYVFTRVVSDRCIHELLLVASGVYLRSSGSGSPPLRPFLRPVTSLSITPAFSLSSWSL